MALKRSNFNRIFNEYTKIMIDTYHDYQNKTCGTPSPLQDGPRPLAQKRLGLGHTGA